MLSGPIFRRTFKISHPDQLLRIGSVQGFSLCSCTRDFGGQCAQPFDSIYLQSDRCLEHSRKQISLLSDQGNPSDTGGSMVSERARRNLECDGIFMVQLPSTGGSTREVRHKAVDSCIEVKEGLVRISKTKPTVDNKCPGTRQTSLRLTAVFTMLYS